MKFGRAAAAVAGCLLPVALLAPPAQAAVSADEQRTADWLATQVPADGLFDTAYTDFFTGETAYYTDYGLNLDLQFALTSLGETEAGAAVYDAIVADTEAYTDSFGTSYAGALGKLATYVELAGDDATAIDGRDLIADLVAQMDTEGPDAGRFLDSPDSEYQSANTIGQSWGVRALDATSHEALPTAVDFLLAQQCEDGGFRLYQTGPECDSGVDATAFAVIALDGIEDEAVDAAVDDAVAWLADQQAEDGSLSDAGNPNTNSSGLAARVFAAHGLAAEATDAADWILGRQLLGCPEDGAIASTVAAFDKVGSGEIGELDRDSFVRASVQAVLALPYASAEASRGAVASLTMTPSSATPKQGETITLTVAGADADGTVLGDVTCDVTFSSSVETDVVDGNSVTFPHASPHVITATHVPTGVTEAVTVEVTPTPTTPGTPGGGTGGTGTTGGTSGGGATSTSTTTRDGRLPSTGASIAPWVLGFGAALVLAGAGVVVIGRSRRAGGAA